MNTTKGSSLYVFTVLLLLSGMTIGKDTSFMMVKIGQHGSTLQNLQHEWMRPWNGKSQIMKTISKLSPVG